MTKKTLADLRAVHDKSIVIPTRIRAALAALEKSGDEFIYEIDLLNLTKPKLSTIDLAKYREEFQDFWAEVSEVGKSSKGRRVWFPTKKLADKWKETTSG